MPTLANAPADYRKEMMTWTQVQIRHKAEWHLYVFRIIYDNTKRQRVIPQQAQVVPNDMAAVSFQDLFSGAYDLARSEALAAGFIDP